MKNAKQAKISERSEVNLTNTIRKGSGGPRTAEGKSRSKQNALKHGIFSKVVVLPGEPQSEYDGLLKGLREHFQPVGAHEGQLVDQLASTTWRQRRHLIAESAEVGLGKATLEWDEKRIQMEINNQPEPRHRIGLTRKMDNPEALDTSICQLMNMKERIESEGFDIQRDERMLDKLYGRLDVLYFYRDFHAKYLGFALIASKSEEERLKDGDCSAEKCKTEVLSLLADEIQRLTDMDNEREANKAKALELKSLCRNVPNSPRIEQLDRHSTTLERSVERILRQLERAQEKRLGQPSTPRIEVNVSRS